MSFPFPVEQFEVQSPWIFSHFCSNQTTIPTFGVLYLFIWCHFLGVLSVIPPHNNSRNLWIFIGQPSTHLSTFPPPCRTCCHKTLEGDKRYDRHSDVEPIVRRSVLTPDIQNSTQPTSRLTPPFSSQRWHRGDGWMMMVMLLGLRKNRWFNLTNFNWVKTMIKARPRLEKFQVFHVESDRVCVMLLSNCWGVKIYGQHGDIL